MLPLARAAALSMLLCAGVSCESVRSVIEDVESWCTPAGSAKCKDGAFYVCEHGRLTKHALCSGDKGCTQVGKNVTCDESRGSEGDLCGTTGAVCSMDGKTALTCRGRGLVVESTCDGPAGCSIRDGLRVCDGARGRVEGPCTGHVAACDEDGKSLLVCDGVQFKRTHACLGPRGCYQGPETKLRCDTSVAREGTPCTDGHACSVDGATRLGCVGGAWAVDRTCAGPHGCTPDPDAGKILCDDPGQVTTP